MSPLSRRALYVVFVSSAFAIGAAAVANAADFRAALKAATRPAVNVGASVQGAAYDGAARTDDGRVQVFVELKDRPAAQLYAETLREAPANDAAARQRAAAASIAQVHRIEAVQQRIGQSLTAAPFSAREIYRAQKVANGIAIAVDASRIAAIAALDGVRRVLPIYAEYPTNSTSVSFLGTPNVWANTIGLPAGADGTGITIGVIDTGVDYMHASFGGTGLLADYQAESADTASFTTVGTAAAGAFPTSKVIAGVDFAGDAYSGANAPVPDANPMDCNGHGSHVSGTAAGLGVTAAGLTFPGPFDANPATYAGLRVGPGTAPKASLYGLRVFGCSGSTSLTVAAIEWAIDPNGDADLSDHLDVINMSLGSNFGSAINPSSIAADNAALAGVIVVTSAGNAGDTFFISGAPGAAARAIATAASVDDGVAVVSLRVNAPASIAGEFLGGSAAFGPVPGGQTANAVIAVDPADGSGPLTTDACSPLINAAAMAGNVCVVDRGTCGFTFKALNCQNAGAIGVIVADNAPGTFPPAMAGVDATVVIPTIRITLSAGNQLKNAVVNTPPVNVSLLGTSGADTMASFSSRGPRRIDGAPLRLKPDIAAPGLNITSVQTGHTCTVAAGCTGVFDPSGFQAGNQALTISGTSMASPHMAGIMALLRQLHPSWSVEELKALAMNYATHDASLNPNGVAPKFGPSRVGAGRVDPSQSALGEVIAMNADDTGTVSITFEPEVVGLVTRVKKVRLINHGLTAQSYELGINTIVDSPGVDFSVPGGSSVSVPAGQSIEFDVQMSADASLMDHVRDPSLFALQGVQANFGDQPRNFLSEEGAYLTFSQGATLKFRLPLYMAEKPASAMSAADTIVTGGAPTGSTTIALSGSGLCTGTLSAGPTCTGTFPNDQESLVTPLELQVVSPRDTVNSPAYADIQYAGTSYLAGAPSNVNNDLVMFGVSTWGDWSTLNEVAINFCVDTNEDGVYDKSVYNANPAIFVAQAPFNDNFVRIVQDLNTSGNTILGLGSNVNLVGPNVIDSGLHLNNVVMLGATPAQLGMIAGDTTFRYKIVTCPASSPNCARSTGANDHCSPTGNYFDQAAGPFFYNWAAPGLNFGGNFLDEDLNGNSLPVSWNTANMATNGSSGALLLHHHNASGTRAEVATLDTAQRLDLAMAQSVSPTNPLLGDNVTYTLTVTNNGPNAASDATVTDLLPGGLTYVSDSGGGSYSTATGKWSIGAVANGATATLQIVATIASTDQVCNLATVSSMAVLDTAPGNDNATVCVLAPNSADLEVAMTVSAPTVLVGDSVTYTITATNHGGDPAYSVNLQEAFAAFPALDPVTSVASQGSYTGATGVWNLASLAPDASATLALTFTAPNFAGALTNQATATATDSDPDTANNVASATTTVLSPATVTATKTVTGSFIPGGNIVYTIVINNSAAFDQQNNVGDEMTDALPSSLSAIMASATTGVALVSGQTVSWNGVVPANGSVTVTVNATINAGTALTTISNQASLSFDADGNGVNEAVALSDDPVPAGATDVTSFPVGSPAAISATKVASGSFIDGGTVTYTIVLSNTAASAQLDNPGDELTDVLPGTLALVSASASSGTATSAGQTVSWNGGIAGNSSVTITIVATINAGTAPSSISNQASIAFDGDGNGSNESTGMSDDPSLGGAADATVFAVASPAQVSATKSVSAGPYQVGDAVTYTIVLSNSGPGAQLDNPSDEFIDPLPAQLELVSASVGSGVVFSDFGNELVTWNGSIAANASVTITIDATIRPGFVGGAVSNQGQVFFDADGDGSNESATTTDDPSLGGTNDATVFGLDEQVAVPTLSMAGVIGMLALILAFGLWVPRRRSNFL